MGAVYEAYEPSMRRTVALKILDAGIDPSSNELSRFEREAWIAGRLNHPNIVKAYRQGEADGVHFIALELIDGGSLADEIRSAKQTGAAERQATRIRRMVSLFVPVTDALEHIHENGIIHRDIKPHNLLLIKDGARMLLTDFGLARDEQASQLTRRGDFLGTIRYMSPEQLLAQRAQVDRRSDIWSLGVSLYEAVTLDVPYSGNSEEAYIGAVSTRDPTPARARNPEVPRDLETVLMKCLERDPERRYGSAAELKDDLLRFLRDEPVHARRAGALVKLGRSAKRHRTALVAVLLCVLVAVGLSMYLIRWQKGRAEDARIRWILEQMIANGSDPEKLESAPALEHMRERLMSVLKRDPEGNLATLAARAAVQPDIKLPAFGLISSSPELWFGAKVYWPLDRRFVYLMDFEASLDGGAWVPVDSVALRGEGGGTNFKTIQQLFGKVSQAPHTVQVGTRISLLDARAVPAQTLEKVFGGSDQSSRERGPAGPRARVPSPMEAWAALRDSKAVRSSESHAASFSINMFDSYPPNFPTQVTSFPGPRPLESYFGPKRIRIVRLRLPPGRESGIAFEWPSRYGPSTKTCANADTLPSDRVAAVELFGTYDSRVPVPLAAEAEVHEDGVADRLLGFPLVVGEEDSNDWMGGRVRGTITSDTYLRLEFTCGCLSSQHPGVVPSPLVSSRSALEGIPDQTTKGRLTLNPSRSLALATKSFERYLGQDLSIPVTIEVITVDAKWIDMSKCLAAMAATKTKLD